jgi:diguanylate cyclase (GGDEF)-like protein
MTDAAVAERTVFLTDLPAAHGESRFAMAVVIASCLIFVVLLPFAKVPLAPVPAFIPIYQSALLVNDLITAVFLLAQSRFSRSHALRLLAGGYLFTALMSTTHALTFPGLFSATGLLASGPQTTAWLYAFWHGGFPIIVIAYACCGRDEPGHGADAAILSGVGVVVAVACGFAFMATIGQNFLPAIMNGDHYAPAMTVVVSCVWALNLAALFALSSRKPYTVLDIWLIVTMCAWLFDIALSAVFNAGRYDLGFYAGRIFGLLAASFVLMVLLFENGKLYVRLIELRESDRDKAAELHRLSTTDQLTGIANRRAFDEALGQEWRRMLRHKMALSLLMIDVDYFKPFNDRYGHVAGDNCLSAVAQAVAARARRAGEMAARYGGEEFAVLLPHTDLAQACKLAELICASVRERGILHEGSAVAPCVTISVGVASIAEMPHLAAVLSRQGAAAAGSPAGAVVLIEAADQALYRAKATGRNRVVAAGTDDGAAMAAAAAPAGG